MQLLRLSGTLLPEGGSIVYILLCSRCYVLYLSRGLSMDTHLAGTSSLGASGCSPAACAPACS